MDQNFLRYEISTRKKRNKSKKKSSKKILQNFTKTQKDSFWALFPVFGLTRTSLVNSLLSLFYVSRSLLLCRISERTNEQILRKVTYRHTEGCIDKHKFIGPTLLGVQKIYAFIKLRKKATERVTSAWSNCLWQT